MIKVIISFVFNEGKKIPYRSDRGKPINASV